MRQTFPPAETAAAPPAGVRMVTRDDPAWFSCGPVDSPDYGCVFLEPVADGKVAAFYDRDGLRWAVTTARQYALGEVFETQGRRGFVVAGFTYKAARAARQAA